MESLPNEIIREIIIKRIERDPFSVQSLRLVNKRWSCLVTTAINSILKHNPERIILSFLQQSKGWKNHDYDFVSQNRLAECGDLVAMKFLCSDPFTSKPLISWFIGRCHKHVSLYSGSNFDVVMSVSAVYPSENVPSINDIFLDEDLMLIPANRVIRIPFVRPKTLKERVSQDIFDPK